jgi:hypothetical protein
VPSGIPLPSATDGYQVSVGDNVLVICQGGSSSAPTSAVNNGVWIVASGAWSRPALGTFSTGTNAVGAFSFLQNGITYSKTALVQINNPAIVGLNPLLFTLLYQFEYSIGQGLYVNNNTLSVDSSLNFINYLDSTPGVPNASGILTLGGYSSRTIIGPTGPNTYPVIVQSGMTGPTASFTNLYVSGPSTQVGLVVAPGGISGGTGSFTNLNTSGNIIMSGTGSYLQFPDGTKQTTAGGGGGSTGATGSFTSLYVSGTSTQVGLITAPGGITGGTGSFTNLNVSGRSTLNGLVAAPGGITGSTGSFTNLYVSGPSTQVGLINAPGGISGGTGSFTNLNVSGPSTLNGLVAAPGGITGATGSFTSLYVSGPSTLNGLITAPGGITGGTGSFTNLNVSGPSTLQGPIVAPGGITGSAGSFTNLNVSGRINAPGGITGATGSFTSLDVSGRCRISGVTTLDSNLLFSDIGTNSSRQISFSGSSDSAFIKYGVNAADQGYLEIATADNNYEPIYFTLYQNTTSTKIYAMTITGDGVTGTRVGIGTTSPDSPLQVVGVCKATSFTSGSDYRYKTNIEPLLPSRTIDHLKPVEYDLINGGNHDMGFIAHEVQDTLPFLVQGVKDGDTMQSLNYTGLIALLVKELQELKKEKKAIEERLERIEQLLNK